VVTNSDDAVVRDAEDDYDSWIIMLADEMMKVLVMRP